ncbi:MAG: hypothetical protein JO091_15020, partial [Acidobacteriaceae bacterium]|nr:hypothetical protein [Acidobacteriaceae bacterium]
VVYFASNDNDRSGRTAFVRELMRHIPVHSYGKSLQNRQLLEDRGIPSKLKTIARYKFTLALENSISHDYVTEKFFQPLTVGSVPVYRGAPNVDEFAPGDRCFINAASFAGPAELAQYLLALDQNDSEYESYLEWKRQPFAAAFLEKAERTAELPFCRLCRKLREML